LREFLSYAFRPFFLANALFAAIAMVVWLFTLEGAGPKTLPVNVVNWHAHEMLVGFGMAAVAGFVLTAVATWTGRPPVHGLRLGVLVVAWLAGRLAMSFATLLPPASVAILDMAFPLLLLANVAMEILGARNARNYPVILVVAALMLANGLYHLAVLGFMRISLDGDRIALHLILHMLLLLVTVIAGRIIPNFTNNWLSVHGQPRAAEVRPSVDSAAVILTVAVGVFAAVLPLHPLTGALALAAALVHTVRISLWRGFATRSEPLLFVLHVAYAWLPAGYLLLGCAVFGWLLPVGVALHALTIGVIALMILGVMTRVALAHTGRQLQVGGMVIAAYWLLWIAVLLRLLTPAFGSYYALVNAAGAAWLAAFLLFTVAYWTVLTGPAVNANR
jgi:uncharacterized protein involved in response to NO